MTQTIEALANIAREAGDIIRKIRSKGLRSQLKDHGELVTSADFASHRVLMDGFRHYFPGLHVVSEEGNHEGLSPKPFIVADELDGTNPFAAGSEHWAVMIAMIGQEPTHGVIHLPDLDTTITAEKGLGCRINGLPLIVQRADSPSNTLLGTEINPYLQLDDWQRLMRLTPQFRAVRSTACAAASTYELLTGITHAYVNLCGGKIWDFAAPSLAVSEAGGMAADCNGRPLRWDALPMSFLAASSQRILDALIC